MSDFGGEQVQRAELPKSGSDIAAEHDFHAQNGKSPGSHIAEAPV